MFFYISYIHSLCSYTYISIYYLMSSGRLIRHPKKDRLLPVFSKSTFVSVQVFLSQKWTKKTLGLSSSFLGYPAGRSLRVVVDLYDSFVDMLNFFVAFSGRCGRGLGLAIKMAGPSCTSLPAGPIFDGDRRQTCTRTPPFGT